MSRFSHDKSGEAPEPVVELTAEEAPEPVPDRKTSDEIIIEMAESNIRKESSDNEEPENKSSVNEEPKNEEPENEDFENEDFENEYFGTEDY